jgi:hypothetical protein
MDWTRSDVISALALLISLGSLTVVWRDYLRNVRAERPIFWAQDHGIVEGGSWHYVKIRVRNRAPYAIRCEQIEIMRPQRAVIVRWEDAMQRKDAGTPQVRPDLTPAACTESASMRLIAAHAGQERYNSWFIALAPKFGHGSSGGRAGCRCASAGDRMKARDVRPRRSIRSSGRRAPAPARAKKVRSIW